MAKTQRVMIVKPISHDGLRNKLYDLHMTGGNYAIPMAYGYDDAVKVSLIAQHKDNKANILNEWETETYFQEMTDSFSDRVGDEWCFYFNELMSKLIATEETDSRMSFQEITSKIQERVGFTYYRVVAICEVDKQELLEDWNQSQKWVALNRIYDSKIFGCQYYQPHTKDDLIDAAEYRPSIIDFNESAVTL